MDCKPIFITTNPDKTSGDAFKRKPVKVVADERAMETKTSMMVFPPGVVVTQIPRSIEEVLNYIECHKEIFGYPPAGVFESPELLDDMTSYLKLHPTFRTDVEVDVLKKQVKIKSICGVRLIERNNDE
jgi:hypothetical protein